jgi:hypothetical protein
MICRYSISFLIETTSPWSFAMQMFALIFGTRADPDTSTHQDYLLIGWQMKYHSL